MSDEMATEREVSHDQYKERSTNKKTPDYVTRARQPRGGGGVDMYTRTPPEAEVHPDETDPEPVGAIAERVLDEIAERQREALARFRCQTPAIRTNRR